MDRILVPVDLSAHSLAASRLAVHLARAHGASVTVMHVIEPLEHASIEPSVAEQMRRDAAAQRERELAELRRALRAEDVDVQLVVRVARPDRAILGAIIELEADLVIMGSHGLGESEFQFGSVAAHVAREAACPVLVVRADQEERFPTDGRFRRPLVAIDYSPFSVPAAHWAARLAAPHATIEMVHIHLAPKVEGYEIDLMRARDAELQRLADLSESIDLAPLRVSLTSELGPVANQLLAFVDTAGTDLVVVGAHGRDQARSVIGTVADRVLRGSTAPVLLLPDASIR